MQTSTATISTVREECDSPFRAQHRKPPYATAFQLQDHVLHGAFINRSLHESLQKYAKKRHSQDDEQNIAYSDATIVIWDNDGQVVCVANFEGTLFYPELNLLDADPTCARLVLMFLHTYGFSSIHIQSSNETSESFWDKMLSEGWVTSYVYGLDRKKITKPMKKNWRKRTHRSMNDCIQFS